MQCFFLCFKTKHKLKQIIMIYYKFIWNKMSFSMFPSHDTHSIHILFGMRVHGADFHIKTYVLDIVYMEILRNFHLQQNSIRRRRTNICVEFFFLSFFSLVDGQIWYYLYYNYTHKIFFSPYFHKCIIKISLNCLIFFMDFIFIAFEIILKGNCWVQYVINGCWFSGWEWKIYAFCVYQREIVDWTFWKNKE